MVIQNNGSGKSALKQNRSTVKGIAEATQRLSSGYRINSAADDAAGLAVSEKLRAIDRGLRQGIRNVNDGINYTCTMDGSAQEIHNMIHRMKELAVEAANDTNERLDREALDLEYQQLLDEIGHITDTAHFNGLPLFEKHEATYGDAAGNVVHTEPVTINKDNDTLKIGYYLNGVQNECVVKIPHGTYTADEVADMIDDELYSGAPNLIIGVNPDGKFTMQVEGGKLDYIGGTGASLFFDTIIGSAEGYLLGVTGFEDDENAWLPIVAGKNDVMQFRLGDDETVYTITLDSGRSFTRPLLIDHINEKLAEAGLGDEVKAIAETSDSGRKVIALGSQKTLTGLSGNFIMIDGKEHPYTSPLYDICLYSELKNTPSVLSGAKPILSNTEIIRGRNDYFVLDVSTYDADGNKVNSQVRIDLLDAGENKRVYATAADLIQRISDKLNDTGLPLTVKQNSSLGIEISSKQYGKSCNISLNTTKVPSGYMVWDLFDNGTLNRVTPRVTNSVYTPASVTAKKNISGGAVIPADANELKFKLTFTDNTTREITVPATAGSYADASSIVDELNRSLANEYPDLADKLVFSAGSTLKLSANGTGAANIKTISALDCTGYYTLIGGSVLSPNIEKVEGSSQTLVSYSDTTSGGSPNVTSTSGSTDNGIHYTTVAINPIAHEEGEYIKDSSCTVTPKGGTSTPYTVTEGDVPVTKYHTTPATIEFKDVLTQFSAGGKSIKDVNLSFDLTDNSGGKKSFSIDIPKGSTSTQAVNAIKNALGSYGTVSTSGNTLTLTSKEEGDKIQFENVGGSFIKTSYVNPGSNKTGAQIDAANNKYYIPASTKLTAAGSNIPLKVDASSDTLNVSACGKNYSLKLTHGTYSSLADLAAELNARISDADGGSPRFAATVSGSSIVLTADRTLSGKIDNISGSCLIYKKNECFDPATKPNYDPTTGNVENPATIRAESIDSHLPLTVDSTNNTVTMTYSTPGGSENLTITIPDGTYTSGSALESAINGAIAADPNLNGKITAKYNSSGSQKGLVFSTVKGGTGYKLSNLGGTAQLNKRKVVASSSGGVADSGSNELKIPAYIRNNRFSTLFDNGGIEINSSNNTASFNIDGTEYTFTIPEGKYVGTSGRDAMLTTLRNGLSAADVTVTYDSNGLTIKNKDGGAGTYIRLGAGNTSPYFMRADSVGNPSTTTMRDIRCQIVGRVAVNSVEIHDGNNYMEFTYTENGSRTIGFTVPNGTYTAASLAAEIQNQIDNILPANSLVVSANTDKTIQITGASPSSDRGFSNFQGSLFNTVFQNASFSKIKGRTEKAGTSNDSFVSYIVGRNTLDPETADELESGKDVIIYSHVNDELRFDMMFLGEQYTVSLTIPAGEYTDKALAAAIQTAGREEIAKLTDSNGNPLPAEYFYASIGLSALGIPENNTAISSSDKLVLCLKLPDDGSITEASSKIDGIRGSAAYRVFYDASKTPRPTRVIGSADLSNGVNIKKDENDTLTVYVDDVPQTITIPAGSYTAKQMSDKLNELFNDAGSILQTVVHDGHLMFYTADNDDYIVDRFSGNAANDLFYGGTSRDDDDEIGIHYGRRTNSYIWYQKTRVDEHLMRINTTGVSTLRRALKAIDRLDEANSYLSRWRALSGANENRSRHTLERITNYSEQLQAADSALRDAEIPAEVNALAKQQLLLNVQNAMLKQSEQQQSSILDVLA